MKAPWIPGSPCSPGSVFVIRSQHITKRLDGRVVIVTGAGGGIGAATVILRGMSMKNMRPMAP
jgi:hypothetical protein